MKKPLTKSLHTVTAVSRVAVHLQKERKTKSPAGELVVKALRVLGYDCNDFPDGTSDPTVVACIAATKKLLGG